MMAAVLLSAVAAAFNTLDLGAIESEIALPVPGGTTFQLDALAATVTVKTSTALQSTPLCPTVDPIAGGFVLRCTSRMLTAKIDGSRLVITQLRGPPTFDGDATLPLFFYDPHAYRLGSSCPGDLPAAKAECAIHAGDWGAALEHLATALSGAQHAYAQLRLGDAALLLGDEAHAAALWDRVSLSSGYLARLAGARLCAMIDNCTDLKRSGLDYDPLADTQIPGQGGMELAARKARTLAYGGRLQEAVLAMTKTDGVCVAAQAFCRRLLLQRLREANGPAPDAVALGAQLGDRLDGNIELAELLARQAADYGAPRYAAGLLIAMITPENRASMAEPALLTAAEIFADAGESARAAALADFAATKLAPLKEKARWDLVTDKILGKVPKPFYYPDPPAESP